MGIISQPYNPIKSGIAKISGGAQQWGIPTNITFSGVGSAAAPNANEVRYAFIRVEYPITLTAWELEVTTGPASNANLRIGVYLGDTNLQPSGSPLYDSGSVAVASAFTGIKTATGLSIPLTPGMYLVALNCDVTMSLRNIVSNSPVILAGLGATAINQRVFVAQTFGAFPNPGTAWTGTSASAGGQQNSVFWQWTE
jgi:hypothetical protein